MQLAGHGADDLEPQKCNCRDAGVGLSADRLSELTSLYFTGENWSILCASDRRNANVAFGFSKTLTLHRLDRRPLRCASRKSPRTKEFRPPGNTDFPDPCTHGNRSHTANPTPLCIEKLRSPPPHMSRSPARSPCTSLSIRNPFPATGVRGGEALAGGAVPLPRRPCADRAKKRVGNHR